MALRILPFRQYNESDVVNLYASDTVCDSVLAADSSGGDAGVFVAVSAGDMTEGPVKYESDQPWNTDYPFLGASKLPVVQTKVTPADTGSVVLGVTLAQTATADENGEKLIYYPQKQLELQAVHSGQAVPILTKGIVTLSPDAFDGAIPAPGANVVAISPFGVGKLTGFDSQTDKNAYHTAATPIGHNVGSVIATGNRQNRGLSDDQFAQGTVGTGAANASGQYAVVQFS